MPDGIAAVPGIGVGGIDSPVTDSLFTQPGFQFLPSIGKQGSENGQPQQLPLRADLIFF